MSIENIQTGVAAQPSSVERPVEAKPRSTGTRALTTAGKTEVSPFADLGIPGIPVQTLPGAPRIAIANIAGTQVVIVPGGHEPVSGPNNWMPAGNVVVGQNPGAKLIYHDLGATDDTSRALAAQALHRLMENRETNSPGMVIDSATVTAMPKTLVVAERALNTSLGGADVVIDFYQNSTKDAQALFGGNTKHVGSAYAVIDIMRAPQGPGAPQGVYWLVVVRVIMATCIYPGANPIISMMDVMAHPSITSALRALALSMESKDRTTTTLPDGTTPPLEQAVAHNVVIEVCDNTLDTVFATDVMVNSPQGGGLVPFFASNNSHRCMVGSFWSSHYNSQRSFSLIGPSQIFHNLKDINLPLANTLCNLWLQGTQSINDWTMHLPEFLRIMGIAAPVYLGKRYQIWNPSPLTRPLNVTTSGFVMEVDNNHLAAYAAPQGWAHGMQPYSWGYR